jgi:hypothetical protein
VRILLFFTCTIGLFFAWVFFSLHIVVLFSHMLMFFSSYVVVLFFVCTLLLSSLHSYLVLLFIEGAYITPPRFLLVGWE